MHWLAGEPLEFLPAHAHDFTDRRVIAAGSLQRGPNHGIFARVFDRVVASRVGGGCAVDTQRISADKTGTGSRRRPSTVLEQRASRGGVISG